MDSVLVNTDEQKEWGLLSQENASLLSKIKIILVEPSHTGNIGSAARAMKTMGLTDLSVVTDSNIITPESTALSAGAFDVLEKTKIYASLSDALADVSFAIGTSARSRTIELPLYQPREAMGIVVERLHAQEKCAIVFGRERTGLTNEELLHCDIHVNIDANTEYSSLNLAMSVQVLSYELRQTLLRTQNAYLGKQDANTIEKPLHSQWENFYSFLENSLKEEGFIKPGGSGTIMEQLRHIFAKADLDNHELQIMYGVMASLKKYGH